MMHLKWILLLVCVGLTLWPLLMPRADRGGKEGKQP
jgi:hypothetical protein